MNVVDIANEIYIDNGSPSDTSIPAIAFWIRGRVGWLNTMLFEDIYINEALELYDPSGPIGLEIISIIKQAYRVYDLEVQVRNSMNALAVDSILSVKDNLAGTSFTRVNRNEIAKTLVALRKEETSFLKTMIDAYRSLKSSPSQVAGDDTMSGAFVPFPYYYPRSIRRY
jgi:hypothetical protein